MLGDLPGWDKNTGECCSYRRNRKFDRKMHIFGSCIIHIGSTYRTCPKLEKFDAVKTISQVGVSYEAWMKRLGKRFYKDYREKGGQEKFKRWFKSRWRE